MFENARTLDLKSARDFAGYFELLHSGMFNVYNEEVCRLDTPVLNYFFKSVTAPYELAFEMKATRYKIKNFSKRFLTSFRNTI